MPSNSKSEGQLGGFSGWGESVCDRVIHWLILGQKQARRITNDYEFIESKPPMKVGGFNQVIFVRIS